MPYVLFSRLNEVRCRAPGRRIAWCEQRLVFQFVQFDVIGVFQPCACLWCCNIRTSARAYSVLCLVFLVTAVHTFGVDTSCWHVRAPHWLKLWEETSHTLVNAKEPSVAMLVEHAIHELQEQLQRVSAGHQAMHQEVDYTPKYGRCEVAHLVEPKISMPDRFGKTNGPSWRAWSCLASDFVGVVHVALKQAMKATDNQKQPIAVAHLLHQFQHYHREGPRIETFCDENDGRSSSRICPRSWTRTGFGTLAKIGCCLWSTCKFGCGNSAKQTTSHTPSKPGKLWTTPLRTQYFKACDWMFFSLCAPQTWTKSWQRSNSCSWIMHKWRIALWQLPRAVLAVLLQRWWGLWMMNNAIIIKPVVNLWKVKMESIRNGKSRH